MHELEFTLVTPRQLIGNRVFGPSKKDLSDGELNHAGLRARVHEAPVAHSLKALCESLGREVKSDLYSSFDVWIVPHRISVIRHSGLSEVTAIGCQVRYERNGRTLSIVSLLPASQFVTLGKVGGEIAIKMACDLTETGEALNKSNSDEQIDKSLKLGPLSVGVSANAEIGLNLATDVLTPHIAAVGVGSTSCDFRFDRHKEQLFNRDIETWALVALPKRTREIQYAIKYYFVSRLAFFPTRCESEWVQITCARAN